MQQTFADTYLVIRCISPFVKVFCFLRTKYLKVNRKFSYMVKVKTVEGMPGI